MGFWKNLFSKKDKEPEKAAIAQKTGAEPLPATLPQEVFDDVYHRAGLTYPISEEEKTELAVIVSSILSQERTDTTFRFKQAWGIDSDKLAAGLIATAVAASDQPHSVFRLRSVSQVDLS